MGYVLYLFFLGIYSLILEKWGGLLVWGEGTVDGLIPLSVYLVSRVDKKKGIYYAFMSGVFSDFISGSTLAAHGAYYALIFLILSRTHLPKWPLRYWLLPGVYAAQVLIFFWVALFGYGIASSSLIFSTAFATTLYSVPFVLLLNWGQLPWFAPGPKEPFENHYG